MRDEMRKLVVWVSALAVFMAVIVLPEVLVRAQARNAQGAKKAAPAPTRNGRPDLQGLWSFATVTPLQRPKDLADKAVLTAEEAAKLEAQAVRDRFADQPPPPEIQAPTTASGSIAERKWSEPGGPRWSSIRLTGASRR